MSPLVRHPGGFGRALVRQGVVDEKPRVVCDRVVGKCEGTSGLGVLESAAGGGGVLSDDAAESCFGFVAGGGLSTRGYGKMRHCNAYSFFGFYRLLGVTYGPVASGNSRGANFFRNAFTVSAQGSECQATH